MLSQFFNKVYRETGKTCEILVPDGPEYRRAKKVFLNSLELSEGCKLNTLDGKKTEKHLDILQQYSEWKRTSNAIKH